MWEGSFPKGLVFLEKDWEEDRLPMDLVEEAGLLGADFVQLSPVQRAKLGGYCKMDQRIVFVVEPSRLHSPNPSREKIFLAADFNGWEAAIGEDRWQLTFENEVFLLSLDWGEFSNLGNLTQLSPKVIVKANLHDLLRETKNFLLCFFHLI